MELKIVDLKTEQVLGPNEVGEILLRSKYMMKGYYNMPELTKEYTDENGKWGPC